MVSIAPCADYSPENCERALREVLDKTGSLNWIAPGMKIAIKANLVTMLKPAAAATTHPALLCALVKMITERGAQAVVGDSPGGIYTAVYVNRVYKATGVRAVEAFGGRLNSNYAHKTAHFPEARKLKHFEYTAWLDDCDGIINFCKLKTHGMMGMSAAVKNLFGAIPGTRKPELHHQFPDARDFADMLVDIHEYFRPRLCIVDAVIGMEGNGPTTGTPRAIGCVLAGPNAYALDEACAQLIGITPAACPTLAAARDRGLVTDGILPGLSQFAISDFRLAPQHDVRFFSGIPILSTLFESRPALKPADCIGCAKCREVCPANAIDMRAKLPVIRRKPCIRCFCCQEFCPTGAMIAKRSLVARMLSK